MMKNVLIEGRWRRHDSAGVKAHLEALMIMLERGISP